VSADDRKAKMAKHMKEVRARQRAEHAVAADRAAAAETAAESSLEQSTEQAPTVNIWYRVRGRWDLGTYEILSGPDDPHNRIDSTHPFSGDCEEAAAYLRDRESLDEVAYARAEQWLNEQLARDGGPDQDVFGGWGNVCFGKASPPPPGGDPPSGLPRGVSIDDWWDRQAELEYVHRDWDQLAMTENARREM
jgi:hypothetical protein